MAGEVRKKSVIPRVGDLGPSNLPAIPFYPNLYRELRSIAATILVAYLEVHYPQPQDDPGQFGKSSDSFVVLDAGIVARDLQISRRTLLVPLSFISSWWPSEQVRARGARANREFLNPSHRVHGTIKPYSLTGPKSSNRPHVQWHLRRNWPYLRHILALAGVNQQTVFLPLPPPISPPPISPAINTTPSGGGAPSFPAQRWPWKSLGEAILAHSVLGGDGRRSRQDRERAMRGEVGKISK